MITQPNHSWASPIWFLICSGLLVLLIYEMNNSPQVESEKKVVQNQIKYLTEIELKYLTK